MDLAIALVVVLVMIGLGIMVWVQDYRKRHSVLFFVLSIVLSGWIMSSALTNHYFGNDLTVNIISNRLAYFFGYLSLLCGLLLTYVFPVKRSIRARGVILLTIMSIAIGVLSLTDYVAGTVTVSPDRVLAFSSGPLLVMYAGAFLVVIAMLVRNLHESSIKKANKIVHKQAQLVLIAFVACALIGLSTNVILPLLGMDITVTARFAPLSAMTLVAIVGYAIVRHGLFDVRLAAVRSVAYILSLATLSLVYYLLAYAISKTLFSGQVSSEVINPISIFLALILAFIFQPVKRFFDRITNRVFYRNRYDSDEFHAKLNGVLTSTIDLRSLLQRTSTVVGDTLKSSQAFFFVNYGDGRHIMAGTKNYRRLPLRDIEELDQYVASHGDAIIVTQTLEKKTPIARLLFTHKIGLFVPLMRDSTLIGYLALGEQLGSGYTKRDIRVLTTVVDELIIAIQNALSVQQVKDINANLEQRVDMATAKLRTSNARLLRVDAAKDEFLSMASHQLRTPLTSIKGYLSMVLEGDIGKVTPSQRQVLEEAFMSSERMVHLIHDFLNVSRLQTGKFMLEKVDNDLAKIVQEEVDALRGVAKARDVTIVCKGARRSIPMSIDDTKLRQVLINYIDNALYYSPSGSTVTVTLKESSSRVELQVTDTGIGVPKSEQAQLFEKFYRASNARKHRPDGTGVGLYLAKKVITAHGGDISFSSRENKGSTFGFWLPLKNDANKLDK